MGENTADETPWVCPTNVRMHSPVEMLQSLAVLSSLPVSTWEPSGEKATERTYSVWPLKVWVHSPVAAFHS